MILGIDIAGASNTWYCKATTSDGVMRICEEPAKCSIADLIETVRSSIVDGAVIDAPLTWAVDPDSGLRDSDVELRNSLPSDCRNWVQSQNCLMAVPLRGQHLGQLLSPHCCVLFETHPTASIYRVLPTLKSDLFFYKNGRAAKKHPDYSLRRLANARVAILTTWCERFGIEVSFQCRTSMMER